MKIREVIESINSFIDTAIIEILINKENIRLYRNKAQGTLIKNRMTTFYNRPEAYFQITYDTFTKDWGIIPTFFDELIDHIESGELFSDEEGIFPIYNIIIKYFNIRKTK